ncbi:hypothetical protein BGZ76_009402 [Entomortierella beljakovae]|nr:hypothetical protein BGZ76_009402 [Entomortierella beljakovae]
MKLNAQIFSSRSLSIERRILIKNFLTALYQSHPIEWIEERPVDEKDQWMEQTLSAVGIGGAAIYDHQDNEDEYGYDYYRHDYDSYDSSSSTSPPSLLGFGLSDAPELSPVSAAAASAVTSRRRPQSLRTSNTPLPRPASIELPVALQSYLSTVFDVDWSVGLAGKEDSLFTSKPIPHTPSRSSLVLSTLASDMIMSAVSATDDLSPAPSHMTSDPVSSYESNSQSAMTAADQHNDYGYSNWANYNISENEETKGETPNEINPQALIEKKPDNQRDQSSQPLVYNHFHIHIHNYPSNNTSQTNNNNSTPSINNNNNNNNNGNRVIPPVKSTRFPKSEKRRSKHPAPTPIVTQQPFTLNFPSPPTKIHHSAPIKVAVAGPFVASSSDVYPPEKTDTLQDSQDEQLYLATSPTSTPSRYSRSPPPPPYTQALEDGTIQCHDMVPTRRASRSAPLPPLFSAFPSPKMQSAPIVIPVGGNEKLMQYQRYQELQKMFLKDEDQRKNEGPRTQEGLGFIKQLFKSNNIRKRGRQDL